MKAKNVLEHIGERYNLLEVIEFSHSKLYTKTRDFYYVCLCNCGNKVITPIRALKQGSRKSCGCSTRELRCLPHGQASLNKLICGYEANARGRGYIFNLSREQFINITSKDCFYCGEPPSNIADSGYATGTYTYSGIDRVDNNKGYIVENCVPCCKTCNIAKQNLTQEDFLNWIKKVYNKITESLK